MFSLELLENENALQSFVSTNKTENYANGAERLERYYNKNNNNGFYQYCICSSKIQGNFLVLVFELTPQIKPLSSLNQNLSLLSSPIIHNLLSKVFFEKHRFSQKLCFIILLIMRTRPYICRNVYSRELIGQIT